MSILEISELRKIASHARSMREAGITLLIASLLLAVFLFIPGAARESSPAPVSVATSSAPDAFAGIHIQAAAAIVYDLSTGEILYGKNAYTPLPLASLTKILTVYAALAELPPETPVTISAAAAGVGSLGGLAHGETFSLTDLSRLTLTASLNEGAVAIAEVAAEVTHRLPIEMLAGAAAALTLDQTYAVNGSGLDASAVIAGGYGSAFDVARLSGALVSYAPDVALATTRDRAQATAQDGTAYVVKNTNPVVTTIPHLLFSKTGSTRLAGGNLALVLDVGLGHPVAIVVLGSSEEARFSDISALVTATFSHFAGVAPL